MIARRFVRPAVPWLCIYIGVVSTNVGCASTKTRIETRVLSRSGEIQERREPGAVQLDYRLDAKRGEILVAATRQAMCVDYRSSMLVDIEHKERKLNSNANSTAVWSVLLGLGGATVAGLSMLGAKEQNDPQQWHKARKAAIGMSAAGIGIAVPIWTVGGLAAIDTSSRGEPYERDDVIERRPCGSTPVNRGVLSATVRRGGVEERLEATTDDRGEAVLEVGQARSLRKVTGDLESIVLRLDDATRNVVASDADTKAIEKILVSGPTQRLPANLSLTPVFEDENGNGDRRLDAEEQARILILVENQGPGFAEDIRLTLSPKGDNSSHVLVSPSERGSERIDRLEAGERRQVEFDLYADQHLQDGKVDFEVVADEPRFPSVPRTLQVVAAGLVPPELVVGVVMEDDDGNGAIEPNDLVNLLVTVQNSGAGPAKDVRVSLRGAVPGIETIRGVATMADLGPLGGRDLQGQPTDRRTVQLQFSVTARYAGPEELPLFVEVSERHPEFNVTLDPRLRFRRQAGDIVAMGSLGGGTHLPAVRLLSDVDGDAVPRRGANHPGNFAIVIGVENYMEANIGRVDFAANDALTFADYAQHVLGVPKSNIITLPDNVATRSRILTSIARLRNEDAVDTLYFYFSGHGYPDTDAYSTPYLVPYDGDRDYLQTTGIAIRQLYDELTGVPARRVILLLDSCFSGDERGGARTIARTGSRAVIVVAEQQAILETGLPEHFSILTASRGNEAAGPYPEKNHGVFSYFLFRGLQGAADLDGDGEIGFREFFEYVHENVRQTSKRFGPNRQQNPTWMGSRDNFVVAPGR